MICVCDFYGLWVHADSSYFSLIFIASIVLRSASLIKKVLPIDSMSQYRSGVTYTSSPLSTVQVYSISSNVLIHLPAEEFDFKCQIMLFQIYSSC